MAVVPKGRGCVHASSRLGSGKVWGSRQVVLVFLGRGRKESRRSEETRLYVK